MNGYINNQYKVIRSLGGNTAEVFLALDRMKTGSPEVAVKVFSVNRDARLNDELFHRETQALTRLDHPGIVRFIDGGRDENGTPFMVTDFVEGQTLEDYWNSSSKDLQLFLRIAVEMLEAMGHAHTKAIVHRDLKPVNILVDDTERVRIIDFGVSKVLDVFNMGLTLRDFVTVAFASPEQLARTNIGTPSDVYSLGAIMFWMLTGRTRNEGEQLCDLVRESDLEEPLKGFLADLTDPEPDARLQTAVSALNRLQQIVQELASASVSHALILTQNVVNKLYALNEILSISEADARQVIVTDLAGEAFVYHEGNEFFILGRRFKLICTIDVESRSAFAIRSIYVPANQFLEADKERSMVVPGGFRILPVRTQPAHNKDFESLVQHIQQHSISYAKRREIEAASKSLTARWEKVLGLQRQIATLDDLRMVYTGYTLTEDGLIVVHLASPITDLPFSNEQSFAMTQAGSPHKQVNVGTYVETSGQSLVLLAYRGTTEEKLRQLVADVGEVSVSRSDIMAALNRQLRALDTLRYGDSVNGRLADILLHPERVTIAPLTGPIDFWHKDLDESKQIAVRKALATNDIFLVQGPPGTGKTTFISELVYQILKAAPRSRILITSQSHVAVDQAIAYVSKVLGSDVSMVRVGRRDRVTSEAQQFLLEEQLQAWVQTVIAKSNSYQEQKLTEIGGHTDKIEMLQSMDQISEMWTNVLTVDEKIAELSPQLAELARVVSELDQLQLEMNAIRERLLDASGTVDTPSIADSIRRFREEFLKVGDLFVNHLRVHSDDMEKYEALQKSMAALNGKKSVLISDAQALLLSLRTELALPEVELNSDSVGETRQTLLAQTQELRESLERFAHIDRVRQEWLGRLGKQDEHDTMFVDQVQIFAGTLLGVAPYVYRADVEFDWVIIDEAARATAPELLVPAVQGRRIVLVGDHHQLPPMLDRDLDAGLLKAEGIDPQDLESTLFEHLFTRLPDHAKVRLSDQWRMHPGIGNLISHVFYERDLKSRSSTTPRDLFSRWKGKTVVWYSTTNSPDRYERSVGTSYVNHYEVRVINNLLAELEEDVRSKGLRVTVGVIAGYSPQRDALRNMLDPDDQARWQALDIRVDTVDSFQGQETDVVFYSMVRSNKERTLGFLADARRLNVALSRGRHLLVIVGDYETATLAVARPKNPFVAVARYIRGNPEYCHSEESGL